MKNSINKGSNARSAARSGRNQRGSIAAEFVCVMSLLVIAAGISVQCYMMVFAAWMNDAACRDAARAAALQSNATEAKEAAAAAAKRFTCGTLGLPLVSLQTGDFEYETFPDPITGKPRIEQGPFVKVTTMVSGQLPFNAAFNGAIFGGQVTFKRTYVFPIIPS